VVVEVMPSFSNKNDEITSKKFNNIREYFKSEAYYPMLARERKNQGSTSITFTIEPDGNIYDIVLPNPKNKYFDYQAIRVIRNSPKWNAVLQKNKPVPVRLNDYVGFYPE
jgi:TonB family protein